MSGAYGSFTAPHHRIISVAVSTANAGPCAKSKRCAAVYERVQDGTGRILTRGVCFNAPPLPLTCDGGTEKCRAACAKICIHAEAGALTCAIEDAGRAITRDNWELVHVKTVDGALVAGGPPSCWQCSKMILGLGIAGVWLYKDGRDEDAFPAGSVAYDAGPRWRFYTPLDFHMETLANCDLPLYMSPTRLPDAMRMLGGIDPVRMQQLRPATTVCTCVRDGSPLDPGCGVTPCLSMREVPK